jgi:hypothetical protein
MRRRVDDNQPCAPTVPLAKKGRLNDQRPRPVYRQEPIVSLVQARRRSTFQFPRIQHLINELPVCQYEFADSSDADAKLDQDELVAALRHASDTRRLILPTFTCAYEAQLLREAGTFRIGGRSVTFPECRFGGKCVGRAAGPHCIIGLGGDGAGVTLMALLFEGELATLLDTGAIDLRGNKRPCLLCYRHLLCDFLFSLQPRHSAPLGSTCIQIYANLQVRGALASTHAHARVHRTSPVATNRSTC